MKQSSNIVPEPIFLSQKRNKLQYECSLLTKVPVISWRHKSYSSKVCSHSDPKASSEKDCGKPKLLQMMILGSNAGWDRKKSEGNWTYNLGFTGLPTLKHESVQQIRVAERKGDFSITFFFSFLSNSRELHKTAEKHTAASPDHGADLQFPWRQVCLLSHWKRKVFSLTLSAFLFFKKVTQFKALQFWSLQFQIQKKWV